MQFAPFTRAPGPSAYSVRKGPNNLHFSYQNMHFHVWYSKFARLIQKESATRGRQVCSKQSFSGLGSLQNICTHGILLGDEWFFSSVVLRYVEWLLVHCYEVDVLRCFGWLLTGQKSSPNVTIILYALGLSYNVNLWIFYLLLS